MYERMLTWLREVYFRDPIERELAPLFQIILILLLGTIAAAVILGVLIYGVEILSASTLLIIGALALVFIGTLVVLRRGHFNLALWILITVLLINQTRGLSATNIQINGQSLLSLIIPISIVGLLMSHRALIVVTAIVFAIVFVAPQSGATAELPPPFLPRSQIMLSFGFFLSFYVLLIGAFGSSFRRVLRTSVARAGELERAHQDLEKHSSQLAEMSERLAVTLTSIGDAVIATDADGLVTLVNGVSQQLTGWTQEQAFGQPLPTVFRIINEETRQTVESPVDKVMRLGTVIGLANHTLLITKDGREIPIDDSGAPIRDATGKIVGVVLVFRDISERKKAERQTELLQEITAALSESVTPKQVASVILESGFRDIGMDSGMVGLLNGDRSALEILMHHGYPQAVFNERPSFSMDEVHVPVVDAVRTNQPIWVSSFDEFTAKYPEMAATAKALNDTQAFVCLPLVIEKQVIGAISLSFRKSRHFESGDRAFILAIGQQAAQALDRARLYTIERQARVEAEEANRLKLQFLAMISHELRTPLTSIKGFATTLLADDISWDAENQTQFIRIIDEESDKLTELVEQLLDLSRLAVGALSIFPQTESPIEIIKRSAAELASSTKEHRLVINLPEDLPRVSADSQRINQVLTNLVSNAVKYSPPNTTITVSARQIDNMIQFDVQDEGIGIPLEMREVVFEAFRQVERKGEGQIKGAGLGLAICKGIIEAHGGQIWIQDLPNPGTTFSFTLATIP